MSIAACEVVVDVDMPLKPSSIVVHSIINPDSVFQAQITSSQNVLSKGDFSFLEGAEVSIYDGENFIETLAQDSDGFYKGEEKPLPGRNYSIIASNSNYKTIQASDIVPASEIAIQRISFLKSNTEQYNQEVYDMTLEFDDPIGENFYQIGMYGSMFVFDRSVNPPVITDTLIVPYYLSSDDPIFSDTYGNPDGFWTFSDVLVEGKRVKINFSIQLHQLVSVDEIEVTVVLRNISYNLYKYQQTASLQQSLNGDPFAEPVPVFTNIENGYGVFGAYRQAHLTQTVERQE